MIVEQYCRLGNMFFRVFLDIDTMDVCSGTSCPHCGTDVLKMRVDPSSVIEIQDAEDDYIIIPEEIKGRVAKRVIPMVARSISGWRGCCGEDCIGKDDDPEFYYMDHNPYSEERMNSDMHKLSPAYRKERWAFFCEVRSQLLANTALAPTLVPANYCTICGTRIAYNGESPFDWGHMRRCKDCIGRNAEDVRYCRDCGTPYTKAQAHLDGYDDYGFGLWTVCGNCKNPKQRPWTAFDKFVKDRGLLKPLGTYAP